MGLLAYGPAVGLAQQVTVPAASVVAPLPQMDTYQISAGQSEGYQVGDRVQAQRAGRTLCEAVIFTVSPHSAVISVLHSSVKLLKGDRVLFLHRKVAVKGDPYVPKVSELGDMRGTPVDYKSHIIPGRFNFFYFYMKGHAKCAEIEPFFRKWLEVARGASDTTICLVNVGSQESRCVAALHFKSFPCLLVYSRRGVLIALNRGHSTYDIFKNPDFMKVMLYREEQGQYVDEP